MIETSTALISLILLGWFIWQSRRQTHLTNIGWVISATRLRGDLWEQRGEEARAAKCVEVADALSSGVAIISHSVPPDKASRRAIERAMMTASGDDWLNLIGVNDWSVNYLPTKAALYWLGRNIS